MINPYLNFSKGSQNKAGASLENLERASPILLMQQYSSERLHKLGSAHSGRKVDSQTKMMKLLQPTETKYRVNKIFSSEIRASTDKVTVEHSQSYKQAIRALQDKIREMENHITSTKSESVAQIMSILDGLEVSKLRLNKEKSKDKSQIDTTFHSKTHFSSKKHTLENIEYKVKQAQFSEFTTPKNQEDTLDSRHIKATLEYESSRQILNKKLNEQLRSNQENEKQIHAILQSQVPNQQMPQQQMDELNKYSKTIAEQKQKNSSLEQQIKRYERQLSDLLTQKQMIQQEFETCNQNQQRQIQHLESQIKEKDKFIESLLNQRKSADTEQNKRIEALIQQNTEYQTQIQMLTQDYLRSQALSATTRKASVTRGTPMIRTTEGVSTPTSNRLSPVMIQSAFLDHRSSRMDLPEVKRSIRNWFSSNEPSNSRFNTVATAPSPPPKSQLEFSKSEPRLREFSNRKRGDENEINNRIHQLEHLQRELNERYELMHRNAQIEEDYKAKAAYRQQLLQITDEIKRVNQELISLQMEKRRKIFF